MPNGPSLSPLHPLHCLPIPPPPKTKAFFRNKFLNSPSWRVTLEDLLSLRQTFCFSFVFFNLLCSFFFCRPLAFPIPFPSWLSPPPHFPTRQYTGPLSGPPTVSLSLSPRLTACLCSYDRIPLTTASTISLPLSSFYRAFSCFLLILPPLPPRDAPPSLIFCSLNLRQLTFAQPSVNRRPLSLPTKNPPLPPQPAIQGARCFFNREVPRYNSLSFFSSGDNSSAYLPPIRWPSVSP